MRAIGRATAGIRQRTVCPAAPMPAAAARITSTIVRITIAAAAAGGRTCTVGDQVPAGLNHNVAGRIQVEG